MSKNDSPLVLIAEYEAPYVHVLRRQLHPMIASGVTLAIRVTIEAAEEVFHRDLQRLAIVCISSRLARSTMDPQWSIVDTAAFVTRMRRKYDGPMIAVTAMSDYRKVLTDAGCNLGADRSNVSELILNQLRGKYL